MANNMKIVHSVHSAHRTTNWAALKGEILKWYLYESKTLDEVREIMENRHGFQASKAQYKRYFDKWNVIKYMTSSRAAAIIEAQSQRTATERSTGHTLVDFLDQLRAAQKYQKRKAAHQINDRCDPDETKADLSLIIEKDTMVTATRWCSTPWRAQYSATGFDESKSYQPTVSDTYQSTLGSASVIIAPLAPNIAGLFDQSIWAIENYIDLCFNNITWKILPGENYYRSANAMSIETDVRGWLSSHVEEAFNLFRLGKIDHGEQKLNSVYQATPGLIEIQAFNLLPEILLIMLRDRKTYTTHVQQIMHQCYHKALELHSHTHSMTCLFLCLYSALAADSEMYWSIARAGLQLLIDYVSRHLGSLHLQSLTLQIDALEFSHVSRHQLEELLERSDATNGRMALTSIECFRAIAHYLYNDGDWEALFELANTITTRFAEAKDLRVISQGVCLALGITIDALMLSQNYEGIEQHVRQFSRNLCTTFGQERRGVLGDAITSRLEDCLAEVEKRHESPATRNRLLQHESSLGSFVGN